MPNGQAGMWSQTSRDDRLPRAVYCPECRCSGSVPWSHEEGCVTGLKQRLRWYEIGFGLVIVVLTLETVLLIIAFVRLGHAP